MSDANGLELFLFDGVDRLGVGEGEFADEDNGCGGFEAREDFDAGAVVETDLNRGFFRFAVGGEEGERVGFFHHERFDGDEQGVGVFLDADFDRGVLAGAQGEAGVGDVGFDEHGAGRLVEGVGEAGDFGFNGVAGDALEGDPDGLADFDFDGFEFGQREGGADDLEVGDRDERGRGRCAARGRGGDVGTHVGVAGGDDAGEGRVTFANVRSVSERD